MLPHSLMRRYRTVLRSIGCGPGTSISIYIKNGEQTAAGLSDQPGDQQYHCKELLVEDLATALSVTGGYPEESETPITLKGYKYDDGDIYLSGSTLYSRSAVAKWSRYLSEKGSGTGHIVQSYTYDTTSQSELCNRAVSKLKKIYDAAVSYE